jgi:hypothetical protein
MKGEGEEEWRMRAREKEARGRDLEALMVRPLASFSRSAALPF